jgi:hypothetical protein
MNNNIPEKDSPAWLFTAWAQFVIAISVSLVGVFYAPVELWVKGFFAMAILFTVSASLTLAKTVRDNHEAKKFVNRIATAKTEKILTDYEMRDTLKVH